MNRVRVDAEKPIAHSYDRTAERHLLEAKPLFTAFFLEKGKGLPADPKLLEGTVIVTMDKKKRTFIHKLIYYGQLLGSLIRRTKIDPTYCHTAIITEASYDESGKVKLRVADVGPNGVKFGNHEYLEDKEEIDLLLCLQPNDPDLRKALLDLAAQTVFDPESVSETDEADGPREAEYATKDLLICWTKKSEQDREIPEVIRRTSYLVADLLRGNQILDRAEEPHAFFCTAFAMTLLQGTILVQALDEDEKSDILGEADEARTRDQVARKISYILSYEPNHPLATVFHSHPILELNARYLMSCDAAAKLQRLASPLEVDQRHTTKSAAKASLKSLRKALKHGKKKKTSLLKMTFNLLSALSFLSLPLPLPINRRS